MISPVSASSFSLALTLFAFTGPILGIIMWMIKRRNTDTSKESLVYLCAGFVPAVVYLLWQLYQKVVAKYGLDSVMGLCILVVAFCIIGALGAAVLTATLKRGK